MSRPDLDLRRLQTQALVDLTRIRHAVERSVEQWLVEAGLEAVTPAQANALLVLFDARAPLRQAQLARALSLSEVTVGRFVKALEEGGWVERAKDPDDSRANRITPTRKAREALPRFIAVSNRVLDTAFAGVSDDAVVRVCRCIATMRANFDPDGADGGGQP
jgi:DNA-binding MarR family transcriptional regulator